MPTMFVTVVIVSTTVMMGGDGMVLFVQSQDLNKIIQAIFCILTYASNVCDEGHSFGEEGVLVTVLIGAFVRFLLLCRYPHRPRSLPLLCTGAGLMLP